MMKILNKNMAKRRISSGSTAWTDVFMQNASNLKALELVNLLI